MLKPASLALCELGLSRRCLLMWLVPCVTLRTSHVLGSTACQPLALQTEEGFFLLITLSFTVHLSTVQQTVDSSGYFWPSPLKRACSTSLMTPGNCHPSSLATTPQRGGLTLHSWSCSQLHNQYNQFGIRCIMPCKSLHHKP